MLAILLLFLEPQTCGTDLSHTEILVQGIVGRGNEVVRCQGIEKHSGVFRGKQISVVELGTCKTMVSWVGKEYFDQIMKHLCVKLKYLNFLL